MRIIPVLDLKGGKVVRAERGRRDLYKPIVTPLAKTAEPVDVAEGLRGLYPFSTFYCADLDAIEGRDANHAALAALSGMASPPDLWVDAGFADAASVERVLADGQVHAVLGSESQTDDRLLRRFENHSRLILSLDFFADGYHGPKEILAQPEIWPDTVIVMTLAKVGSNAGPDRDRLRTVKDKAGDRTLVAAGGVRDAADLETLCELGIGAALVATSLHNGSLTPEQLARFGADNP